MVNGAEGGLCAIGMVGEESAEQLFVHTTVVLCQTDVLLFIDGFQLGVEEA